MALGEDKLAFHCGQADPVLEMEAFVAQAQTASHDSAVGHLGASGWHLAVWPLCQEDTVLLEARRARQDSVIEAAGHQEWRAEGIL